MRTEEEDDDEAETDIIEIPAITIAPKTPNVRVEKPKTPPRSILKQPVAKITSVTPKHDLKDSIWRESKSPIGSTRLEEKSISMQPANDHSPNPMAGPKNVSTFVNSKQNGKQEVSPRTLPEIKNKRISEREFKQPNGVPQNKNGPEKGNVRDSRKQKKFSNPNEVVSGEEDGNKCCTVS